MNSMQSLAFLWKLLSMSRGGYQIIPAVPKALQDDFRATQLLNWHRELENIVAHLQLRINTQREAAEAELHNIHNAKAEGLLASQ